MRKIAQVCFRVNDVWSILFQIKANNLSNIYSILYYGVDTLRSTYCCLETSKRLEGPIYNILQ
jgi:hypothetical protein